MIWLMMKAAITPPNMFPRPPNTQIMKVIGPKVRPMKGCTSYCSTRRHAARPARPARIDAHQAHDLAVLRDGADRGAEIRPRQEEIESGRAHDRGNEGEQPREA